MSDDDIQTTPLIDSYALGVDMCNALGHVILVAADVLRADEPDPQAIHEALENVCEMAAAMRAVSKTCSMWDIYLESGLETIIDQHKEAP